MGTNESGEDNLPGCGLKLRKCACLDVVACSQRRVTIGEPEDEAGKVSRETLLRMLVVCT
jgi:hypothetical protein